MLWPHAHFMPFWVSQPYFSLILYLDTFSKHFCNSFIPPPIAFWPEIAFWARCFPMQLLTIYTAKAIGQNWGKVVQFSKLFRTGNIKSWTLIDLYFYRKKIFKKSEIFPLEIDVIFSHWQDMFSWTKLWNLQYSCNENLGYAVRYFFSVITPKKYS